MPKKKVTRPELNRICNVVPSHNVEADWTMDNALAAGAIAAPVKALPASVDLRETWWEIGDQGPTGSCVGWGSTDSVARYHFVKAGKLAKKEHLSIRLSWMGSKELDTDPNPNSFIESAGTTLKGAMDILRKKGSVLDSILPFQITNFMYTGEESTFYATAATRKIASYFNLGKNTAKWRDWLATNGPILAALNVDETWDSATANKGKLDAFKPGTTRGGHAIAIVGYTADKRFIVRNSWGTAWGDKGFGYATEAYIKDGFFNESYGITL
ncbi:MAG: C1 family peptidase [Chlorobiaceae bacterium]|nr:C1 family peptidase [Chlorobiaceae bacterium]NTW74891.1 C1 family peptidase [Chlorobiaceae bacterium]